jgi:hypothetical protein
MWKFRVDFVALTRMRDELWHKTDTCLHVLRMQVVMMHFDYIA